MSDKVTEGPPESGKAGAEALQALNAHREKEQSARVAAGEGITSLNRLLQWGAANSSKTGNTLSVVDGESGASAGVSGATVAADRSSAAKTSDTGNTEPASTVESQAIANAAQLKKNREWLDVAFPDMFADVKKLTKLLASGRLSEGDDEGNEVDEASKSLTDEKRVEILEAIEEYMADLNFATNITKLGTMDVVIENASHSSPEVRTAAIWVLGTAMQNVHDVKEQVVRAGGLNPILAALDDSHVAPRAKACMAASALMQHAPQELVDLFVSRKGLSCLMANAVHSAPSVKRRCLFMLEHGHAVGLAFLMDAAVGDRAFLEKLSVEFKAVDPTNLAYVSSFGGAFHGLAKHDRKALLNNVPSVVGLVSSLVDRVKDATTLVELKKLLIELRRT